MSIVCIWMSAKLFQIQQEIDSNKMLLSCMHSSFMISPTMLSPFTDSKAWKMSPFQTFQTSTIYLLCYVLLYIKDPRIWSLWKKGNLIKKDKNRATYSILRIIIEVSFKIIFIVLFQYSNLAKAVGPHLCTNNMKLLD